MKQLIIIFFICINCYYFKKKKKNFDLNHSKIVKFIKKIN
jgi:hypothetical protein